MSEFKISLSLFILIMRKYLKKQLCEKKENLNGFLFLIMCNKKF